MSITTYLLLCLLAALAGYFAHPGVARVRRYRRFRKVLGYPPRSAWQMSRENYLA